MWRLSESALALVTRLAESRRSALASVGLGLGLATLAILARALLQPVLGDEIPWVTFFGAVLLAALSGGLLSAVVTIVACAALGMYFFAAPSTPPPAGVHVASLLAFVVNASLIALVGAALRGALKALNTARDEASAAAAVLEVRERELVEQVADLRRLHAFGTTVVGNPDRDDLLRTLLDAAIGLQHAARGFIELYDPTSHRLVPGVAIGHSEELFQRLAHVPVAEGEGACGSCAARGERVIVEDVETDAAFAKYRAAAREAGFASVWSAPMLTRRGELVGVLSTHFEQRRRPTDREIQLVELYARMGADAVDTANLYARAREARTQAEDALAKLREQDRRKDEFLAMLAHELRNPLAPVRSIVDVMRLRGGTTLNEREAQILDRQTRNLARIVDDLLDVARITHGKVELKREPTDLARVIARAVDSVRKLIEERRHTLQVHAPNDTPHVDGDPIRLEQVLVNLLTNAAKYTEPGGHIELLVSSEQGKARVRISDTGKGLPAGALESIFNLFEQGDRRLDRSGGGLGIGLTIVRRLVELHGGRVFASSRGPDQGSEFTVELPTVRAQVAEQRSAAEPSEMAGNHSLRVLIVDDNADAASSLAELARLQGCETSVCHDGVSALKSAADDAPDVVLLDIGLPGMDGYTVAERLRASGSHARIVAVSGYGEPSARERSRTAGFEEHWVKPVPAQVLLDFLAAAAERQSLSAS